jgi:hypothetical protein
LNKLLGLFLLACAIGLFIYNNLFHSPKFHQRHLLIGTSLPNSVYSLSNTSNINCKRLLCLVSSGIALGSHLFQHKIPHLQSMQSTSSFLSADLLNSSTSLPRRPSASSDSTSLTSRPFFTRGSSLADDETTFCPSIPA